MNDLLTAPQVVVMLGISENTLNFWYRFKRENPDNEVAQLLPDYQKDSEKGKRYWKRSDLAKLTKFQRALPKGRNGIMGAVTQKYYKKEEDSHGKKSITRGNITGGRTRRKKDAR